jgi:hypothetical protein
VSRKKPVHYDESFCQDLLNYFSAPPYISVTKTKVLKDGGVVQEEVDVPTDFPTISGFAVSIGTSRRSIYEWEKAHFEFKEALNIDRSYQEVHLVTNGLRGLFSTAFAIFTAKNVLKWRDKHPDETDQVNVNNNLAIDDEKLKQLIKVARKERQDADKR